MQRQKAIYGLTPRSRGHLVARRTQRQGARGDPGAAWRMRETLQCLVELAAHRSSLMSRTRSPLPSLPGRRWRDHSLIRVPYSGDPAWHETALDEA